MPTITVTDFETSLKRQKDFDWVFGMLEAREFNNISDRLDHSNRTMVWADDILDDKNGHAPRQRHIEHIIKVFWDEKLLDKNILVHCRAGISRSTAIAIGLLVMTGTDIPDAFNIIHSQRSRMWPNQLILTHFDRILGLKGTLVEFDRKWKGKQVAKMKEDPDII